MIFQTLDDKSECVGVYVDGKLHFDSIPSDLSKTWKYTGSITDPTVEYAWLYCGGNTLSNVCPEHLKDEWEEVRSTFRAYLLSLNIAKINLRQNCFFDLVPYDFLMQFCEIRNKITEHVFDTNDRPENYDHLNAVYKLLHKINYQKLNVNLDGCRSLMTHSDDRQQVQKLLKNVSHHISYNIFGTVTGRLSTHKESFPVLTMKGKFRKLIKPTNDWFVSLDYNGAEVRTFLSLCGHEQPQEDIHNWNKRHLYGSSILEREAAKVMFFSTFYNPSDSSFEGTIYSRKQVLDKFYDGKAVKTPMGRKINVNEWKAFNYLIQSTTSDLTLDRAVALDKALEGKKSKVAFIIHDEVVLDIADDEREELSELKKVFGNTKMGRYLTNVKAGKNFGEMKELKI